MFSAMVLVFTDLMEAGLEKHQKWSFRLEIFHEIYRYCCRFHAKIIAPIRRPCESHVYI